MNREAYYSHVKPSLLVVGISVCVLLAGEARPQSNATPNPIELLQKGQVDEAKKILIEALKKDPGNDHINAVLGQIAFSGGATASAATAHACSGRYLFRH